MEVNKIKVRSRGGSGPKNYPKSSKVYMIENLFTPKLFTNVKIIAFRDSVPVFVRIGMP